MVDGATKSFVQAYNAHAAVDAESQIIVAASLTQRANDKQDFLPLLTQIEENLGALPDQVTADSGFFSETNLQDPSLLGVDLLVPPERSVRHSPLAETMRERLAGEEGRAFYARRKATVEPVFGQIKEARGFRCFSSAAFVRWRRNGSLSVSHTTYSSFSGHTGGSARSSGREGPRPQTPRGCRERISPCLQPAAASAS